MQFLTAQVDMGQQGYPGVRCDKLSSGSAFPISTLRRSAAQFMIDQFSSELPRLDLFLELSKSPKRFVLPFKFFGRLVWGGRSHTRRRMPPAWTAFNRLNAGLSSRPGRGR
jgi:hypothetical protein